MSPEIWIELIRLVPTLLWVALVIAVLLVLRTQLRARLSDLIGLKVGMSGVEATFLVQELEKAEIAATVPGSANTATTADTGDTADKAPPSPSNTTTARTTHSDRSQVIRRAERNEIALRGARLLWVDDYPRNNDHLMTILSSLGVEIDIALRTDEALAMIAKRRYDLIITDMGRGDDHTAGTRMLSALREHGNYPSVIFYASRVLKPLPAGAFGSADQPDQLLHLVMDALERERS